MRYILFLLLLSSCNSVPDTLAGIPVNEFRSDRGACMQKRSGMVEALRKDKNVFLGKKENEILDLLGRYDAQVLDSRQKKIFVYFLEKGPHCEQVQLLTDSTLTMALRFNAVSLVNEVTFHQGMP